MPALSPVQSSRRLTLLFALLIAVAIMVLLRLFYWQVMRYDDLSRIAAQERGQTVTEYARRGDIISSDGVLLATDVYGYQVTAHPAEMVAPESTAGLLAPVLNLSQSELSQAFQQHQSTVMVAYDAPSTVGPKLNALHADDKLPGIDFVATPRRRYPGDSLAAHILGFVNANRAGAYGVEQYYNDTLSGHDGQTTGVSDALRSEFLWFDSPRDTTPVVDGSRLVLTLNSSMQNIAERELAQALHDSGGTGGQIIILDAQTSAILALASSPAPDLNAYSTTPLSQYTDPAISLPYEPGSVFKVVTLAAGLDSGKINQNITFNDTGTCTVGGHSYYNHDFLKPGIVDLVGVMKLSLNVEACKIAIAAGAKTFYQYLHDFGFGSLTGVDLWGEISGTVKNPGDGIWYESDLGSNAFGQGLATTPLQMANALAAVADGGKLNRPYIVAKVIHPDGSADVRGPHLVRQVIKPQTAQLVNSILSRSIGTESINQAVIPGYAIAGKTGTAQIPIPGGYDPKWTIASFGGWLPVNHPQFVILVKIDRPTKSQWGSVVASPVFARVAQQLVQLTGLAPDAVRAAQ